MSEPDLSRLESELERARALLREERTAFEGRLLALETERAELTAQVQRLRRSLRRAQSGEPATPPQESSAGLIGRSLARLRGRR
jgi:hypothetical protein